MQLERLSTRDYCKEEETFSSEGDVESRKSYKAKDVIRETQ